MSESLERAKNLLASAASSRSESVQREMTARAQALLVFAVVETLQEIRDVLVLKQNEVAAHAPRG